MIRERVCLNLLNLQEKIHALSNFVGTIARTVLPVESLSLDQLEELLEKCPPGYYRFRIRDRIEFLLRGED